MKWIKIFVLLVIAGAVMSCAHNGQYLSKHAFENPSEGISIVHPIELEKAGIEKITTFVSVMDPGLWIEILANGGVWPSLALLLNGEMIAGYSYLSNINYWGDFLLQSEFYRGEEELSRAKIIHLNRDGGWIYQLSGIEINYNPEKFDNDEEYRREIFGKYGMSFLDLNLFWSGYLKEKEISPSSDLSCVQEIAVGSLEWQEHKKKIAEKMRHNYEIDGEIRCGYLPIEEFRRIAVENNGFTGGGRFVKYTKLPLFALPFTGIGFAAMAGISIANGAVVASIDNDWSGFYARAKTVRHQMAPLFRQICQIYKGLLKARDEQIKILKTNLYLQNILNEN